MTVEEDIGLARQRLQNALGERFSEYMLNLKKWFSGKTSKQEFDIEARSICTDNYIHLHNEFLLCIMTECNNFTSIVNDVIDKPLPTKNPNFLELMTKKPLTKQKKKLKTSNQNTYSNRSTMFRFVPVDSIKHAPSICLSSLETAATNQDFSLEFCARERSLPYFKMIYSRFLLGAIDANLQSIDLKAVFLLAEATIWFLKNIISQLASRSQLKNEIRYESAYETIKINQVKNGITINESRQKASILKDDDDFAFIPNIFKKSKQDNCINHDKKYTSNSMSDYVKNPEILPITKLPTTLFDLKNMLQVHNKKLIPSHSIYTINMEKLICNLYHENDTTEQDNTE